MVFDESLECPYRMKPLGIALTFVYIYDIVCGESLE